MSGFGAFWKTCAFAALLAASSAGLVRADVTSRERSEEPPKGKPALSTAAAGQVCFSLDEAAAIDRRLIEQARDLAVARARARRWGGILGCGAAMPVGVQFEDDVVGVIPVCGVFLGVRFP